MPTLSFEVGAIFSIDAQPAISSLEAMGAAFTELETMLRESVAATQTAVNQMIAEVSRLAEVWRTVGTAARESATAGEAVGGRGGVPPRGTDEEREAARQLREDRLNADAINRNENQIYSRQEAIGRRENDDRNRSYDNQRRMAEWENNEFDRLSSRDDGISIPPPPRTGITDINRAYELPPRGIIGDVEEGAAGAAAGRATARGGGRRGGIGFRGEIGDGGFRGGGAFHGMAPFVAIGGAYGAYKSAMTEDRALAQALQEMGYDPREAGFQVMVDELRGKVAEATAGTIYSESHGASALPGTAGQFTGLFNTPAERRQKYEAVLPSALKFAEVAEQYHRGAIGESYKAGIGYLAMTGQTDSGEIAGKGLSQLLALSLATGDTIAQEQNVLKYSLPIGKAAGADMSDVAALTGFMEILGFRGTTAGTGVGQMIMGLTNTGGPLAAQQHREQSMSKAFQDVLHLKPEELHKVRASRGKEHDIALQELGLEDPKTGKIFDKVAPGGHLSIAALVETMSPRLEAMTPMQGLGALRNAFTVRGSREAAELSDPQTVKRLLDFFEGQKHPPNIEDLQKQLATRPLQQFEQMLANIANIGNTLATSTLGPLNRAFMTMNGYLAGFNAFLKEHQGVTEALGWGGLGLAALTGLGVAGGAVKTLWRYSGARAVTSGVSSLLGGGGGAAIGEEALAGIGGGSLLGVGGLLGGGAAALLAAGGAAGHMNAPFLDDFGRQTGTWGGRPNGAVSLSQINYNSFNGLVTDDTMRIIIDKITAAMKGFLQHASEMAQGAHQSQFDYSGGH